MILWKKMGWDKTCRVTVKNVAWLRKIRQYCNSLGVQNHIDLFSRKRKELISSYFQVSHSCFPLRIYTIMEKRIYQQNTRICLLTKIKIQMKIYMSIAQK